jgi:hypothetical protein
MSTHNAKLTLTCHSSTLNIHSVHSTIEDAKKIGLQLITSNISDKKVDQSCDNVVCIIQCSRHDDDQHSDKDSKNGKVECPEVYYFDHENPGKKPLLGSFLSPLPSTFPLNSIFIVSSGYFGARYLSCFDDQEVALSSIQSRYEKSPHLQNRVWSNVCLDCSLCSELKNKIEESKLKLRFSN